MSLFRKTLIKDWTNQTLKTLRYKLFVIPRYVTNSGRERALNLALALKKKEMGEWTVGTIIFLHKFSVLQLDF